MDEQRYNIYLIGFMGVGKSTVAEVLCDRLGAAHVEMDQIIVEQQDMAISDIFAEYGEKYFRKLETDLLLELKEKELQVVSCGGGVVLKEENVDIMKASGKIVWLTADPETIYERVKDSTHRPLLNENMSVEYIEEMMKERKDAYDEASDIRVSTDRKTVETIVDDICRKLKLDR